MAEEHNVHFRVKFARGAFSHLVSKPSQLEQLEGILTHAVRLEKAVQTAKSAN